jgi:hypothetical protein
MKWTPHQYQKDAIQFMLDRGAAGLFAAPGLGKTSISLTVFSTLQKKGLAKTALVIAPLRPAYSTWAPEALKWDHLSHLRVVVLHGPDKLKRLEEEADVYVINYEGLRWLYGIRATFDVLIVDELTKLKHTNTQRFKMIKPMLGRFKRRYGLTGTPAPNGLGDLFGQMYILDQGASLGQYITHFRQNYFTQSFNGFDWTLRPGAADIIYKRIAPIVLRIDEGACVDLPDLVMNTITVTLPPEARTIYRQMEAAMVTEVMSRSVTAANAATASGKCRQIANGGIYINDEEANHIHDAKTDAVRDLVDELQGTPVLIGYDFDHDRLRLQEAFPGAPYIGGGVSTREFSDIEQRWNKGEIPVLLAQTAAVAHGLNLQGTHAAVCFYSVPWSLETYEQFIRRVWRQGQRQRVIVHHIVAEKTVDELVMRAIARKDITQTALLDALRDYAQNSTLSPTPAEGARGETQTSTQAGPMAR